MEKKLLLVCSKTQFCVSKLSTKEQTNIQKTVRSQFCSVNNLSTFSNKRKTY